MILKILVDGEPKYEFTVNKDEIHQCSYIYTPVKELQIVHFVKSQDEMLFNNWRDKISLLPVKSNLIVEVWEEANNSLLFTVYGSFKEVLNRVQLYGNPEGVHSQETFSIRFFRDQDIRIDKKNKELYCDKECIYLKDGTCELYKKKLNLVNNHFLSCTNCFSDSGQSIYVSLIQEEYNKLIKNYSEFAT